MRKLIKEETKKIPDITCKHNLQVTGRCKICGKLNMINRRLIIQYFDDGSIEKHEVCLD